MPFAQCDGADLYWEKSGDGPPLILAAGLGGVHGYWQANRAALERHFTLYLFDQRGTGNRPASRSPRSSNCPPT